MNKVIKMYLHSNKETNSDIFIENFLENDDTRYNEIPKNFLYALYEVEFEVEVNTETGDITILKVNGKSL